MDEKSKIPNSPVDSEKKMMDLHQIENAKTNERVPGHPAYYEEGGLRTYGDGEDHDHEPPVLKPFVTNSVHIW